VSGTVTTEIVAGHECDFYKIDSDRWVGEADSLGICVEADSMETCREVLHASIRIAAAGHRAGL
jgi:hypothetical protein